MYELPKTLKIDVIQDDIDQGDPNDPHSCPIALAMNRALKDAGYYEARASVLDSIDHSVSIRILGPDGPLNEAVYWPQGDGFADIHQFVWAFDVASKRDDVRPFSATLNRL